MAKLVALLFLMLVASGSLVPLSDERAEAQTSPGGNDTAFVWAEQFGTSANDSARSVAVDPKDGSPVVAGSTNGSLDPEGSPLDPTVVPSEAPRVNTNKGGEDAFVRKHAQDGAWKWTRQFGSSLPDTVHDVAVAPDGSAYVAGYGNPANRNTTQGGAYIAKYNPDGTPATLKNADGSTGPWIKQFSGGRIWTFSVDPEGNPYIAVSINSDVYMYKLNPQGQFEASEPFGAYGCYGSAYLDIAFGSAVRGSADPSVYVTGVTTGYLDDPNDCRLNDGTDEMFLIRFDGMLNKKWDEQFGTNETNIASQAMGVAVDSNGDAYVVGHTFGTIYDPTGIETKKGGRDLFVVKFDEYLDASTGAPRARIEWAEQSGTAANEFVYDVAIDPGDNLYVTGSTGGAFDASKPSAGGTDAFAAKYDKAGNELVVRQFGTPGSDSARGVAHDPLTKSVLVAGNTDGSLAGNTNKDTNLDDGSSFDGFLVKMRVENLDGGPPPGSKPKTPLIFVPGIAGSELLYGPEFDNLDEPGPREKWPRAIDTAAFPDDAHLRDMKLADEGVEGRVTGVDPFNDDPRYRTRVGDILRYEPRDLPYQDVYANTIAKLEAAGYVEGETLFPFPYDWRKDARGVKGGGHLYGEDMTLVQLLDFVREKNRRPDGSLPKVDVMAHSRGGIVTLTALRDQNSAPKVRKVMTLGTPVLGSVKALSVLQYKAGCFLDPAATPVEACTIDASTLQEVVENMPGIYELLPSRQFHGAEGSPLRVAIDEDGNGAPDGEKSYDYWTGTGLDARESTEDNVAKQHNETLMRDLASFHDQYDGVSTAPPADPGVEIVRVVGDSLATADFIEKRAPGVCLPSALDPSSASGCVEYELRYTNEDRLEGGDGTVPLHSADLYNPDRGFDLRGGYPNFYAHNVEHGALATDDSVLNFAISYFTDGDTPTQASTPSASVFSLRTANAQDAATAPEDLERMAEQSGLGTTPESFSGLEVSTSGPVTGYVEDEVGGSLGDVPDGRGGAVELKIAGGSFDRIGDNRSFFVNDPTGSYRVLLRTTGAGNVKVKVRAYEDGKLSGQAVYRASPLANTRLELDLVSGEDPGRRELLTDDGADGSVDRRSAPASAVSGAEASETDAPTTTLAARAVEAVPSAREGERGRPRPTKALVTLTAEDGVGGSGTASTYYALDGDEEVRTYRGSFEVPIGTAVRFASVDRADNVEVLRKEIVDDAPSRRLSAEAVPVGDDLVRYLDPKDDEDWFVFEADGVSDYKVRLLGLPADYDLELYDDEGRSVASPAERGKRSEEAGGKLGSGRYYAKVSGFAGAWDGDRPYRLKFDRNGGAR